MKLNQKVTKTSGKKSSRLIELVRGKTLLKDAPLTRDLILSLYEFDIDDKKDGPVWNRRYMMKKFSALVRYVRNNHPEFNFHIVEDEENNRQRHCVHIIEGVNGDLLLKELIRAEKRIQTMERRLENTLRSVRMDPQIRERRGREADKQIAADNLAKQYCTRKQIKRLVIELRSSGRFRSLKGENDNEVQRYKPNFAGIQSIFGSNAVEIRWEMILYNEEGYNCGSIQQRSKTEKEFEQSLKEMLKEIILCDYQKKNYHRSNRNEYLLRVVDGGEDPDYLGVRNNGKIMLIQDPKYSCFIPCWD